MLENSTITPATVSKKPAGTHFCGIRSSWEAEKSTAAAAGNTFLQKTQFEAESRYQPLKPARCQKLITKPNPTCNMRRETQ